MAGAHIRDLAAIGAEGSRKYAQEMAALAAGKEVPVEVGEHAGRTAGRFVATISVQDGIVLLPYVWQDPIKNQELYIASEVVASVAQAGEVGAQEPEQTGSM